MNSFSGSGAVDDPHPGDDRQPITILHVDDEPEFAAMAADMLERADDRFTVSTETSPTDALSRLQERDFDCVVSDFEMAEMNGIEFYEAIADRDPDLPFILFTGEGSEEVASQAISAGITDYVQKGIGRTPYELLANRIETAVEQYRSAKRHQYQRKQYKDLFDQAPVMYVLVRDVDGRPVIEDCNDRFLEKLGYDREEVIGRQTTEFFSEESAAQVYEHDAYERALRGDFDLEERTLVAKDGQHIETILRASPRLDEQGQAIGVQTLYLDVTEQLNRAKKLERYETIIEASGDPVYTVDADGRMTYINEAFTDLVGYDESELIGEHVSMVMDEADIQRGTDLIEELLTTEKERGTFEMDLIHADGTRVTCEAHVALLPFEDEFRGTTGIHRVITERKARERKLERQKEQLLLYEAIVEGTNDGVYVFDERGTIEYLNHDILSQMGVEPDELVGEHVSILEERDLVSEPGLESLSEAIDAIAEGNKDERRIQLSMMVADEERTFDIRLTALQQADRTPSVLAFSRDVTEERRRQRELERQNERLEEFASVVSHDLRNPLNVADGRLGLAREECESEHLADVRQALVRMQNLIEDLLTFARHGETVSEVEAIDLGTIARNCWENVETSDATLVVTAEGRIKANRGRFQQFLENLFGNAVEHGGSDVTITVGDLDAGGFFVEDDGSGISPDIRDRIFESGFSTADDGTGFGLSIVRQIAEAHGWTISIAEHSGTGARFEVTGVTMVD